MTNSNSPASGSAPDRPLTDHQPMSMERAGRGPLIITALVVVLLILHQDNWFWTDGRLVLGIIPVGLFWHACISVAASATWYLATRIAWPVHETDSDPAAGEKAGA